MKAVVYYGPNDIRYESSWPEPNILNPGDVKIEVSWCGICGTDMEDYQYGGFIPVEKPHPESGKKAPLIIGHEFSGRIVELGAEVKNLKEGQKVAIECVRVCHRCYWCRQGEYASCTNQVSIGQVDDGGMAEYVIVPAENCIVVPESMDDKLLALAEPLAVMVRAVGRAGVSPGSTVTIIGAGTIGLMGASVAYAAGARKVITIAHGGRRAEIASEMNATHVFNSKIDGWYEEFLELTDGHGSDIVIDTGGNVEAMRMAFKLTRQRGRCVFNSVINDDVPLPVMDMVLQEKEVVGTLAHSFDKEFLWAVDYLMDKRIDPSPMITSTVFIEEAVTKGFDRLKTDRNEIKILVTPKKSLL